MTSRYKALCATRRTKGAITVFTTLGNVDFLLIPVRLQENLQGRGLMSVPLMFLISAQRLKWVELIQWSFFFTEKQRFPVTIIWLFYYPISIHRRLIHVNSCTDEHVTAHIISRQCVPLLILFHQLACPLWSI